MDDEILKRIEERLTRLEAGLAQGATATAAGPAAGAGSFVPPGGFVVDPPPWGGGGWGRPPVIAAPIGNIGDPPPFDISHFTLMQLETSLHSIAAEKARLESTENLIKQRIKALKAEG